MRFVLGGVVLAVVVAGALLVAGRSGWLHRPSGPVGRAARRRGGSGRLARRVDEARARTSDQQPGARQVDEYIDAQAAVWDRYSQHPVGQRRPAPQPAQRRPTDRFEGPGPTSRGDPASPRQPGGGGAASSREAGGRGAGSRREPVSRHETASRGEPAPRREPVSRSETVGIPPADVDAAAAAPTGTAPTFGPVLVEAIGDPGPAAAAPAAPQVVPLARRSPKPVGDGTSRRRALASQRAARPTGAPRRSPDQVRSNLLDYRSGLRRGREEPHSSR